MAVSNSKVDEKRLQEELSKQFYEVMQKVIMSEKATRLAEFENKLSFEVARYATKPLIKVLVENEYKKAVKAVNTQNAHDGKKRAIVTFVEEGTASDLSAELGGN